MLAGLLNCYKEAGTYFERYLTQLSLTQFTRMVKRFQSAVTDAFDTRSEETLDIMWDGIVVLDFFYKANLKREEDQQASYKDFYNESINRDINLSDQYADWIEQKAQQMDPNESYVNANNIMNYPWILDAQAKSDILLIDSRVKQKAIIDQDIIDRMILNPFGG
jgi:hypothetical protein